MSPFGAIYTLLESWPTESTRAYLAAEDGADRQLRQSQILGTEQQMLKTMSTRVVPSIVREMQIRVPRSTVEKHLYEVLASLGLRVLTHFLIVGNHVFTGWAAGCMHRSCLQISRHQIVLTDSTTPIGFCPSLTLS